MTYCTHYIVGVSVGVMAQPTAIAVIEQESRQETDGGRETTAIRLRHLERMSMASSYPDLASKLRAIIEGLSEKEKARESDLLVDMTGTGKAIIEFFKNEDLDPTRVVITAGHGEQRDDTGIWRIAKVELVGSLQVLFQTDKFKVASGLTLVDELKDELTNFRMKTQAMNGSDIESWREGKFDDLVFAVAIATWQAQKHVPFAKRVMDEFDRKYREQSGTSWMV